MPPVSNRGAFFNWVEQHDKALAPRILLPETYEDWKEFDTYSDLLQFEEDLGHVTSAVVIFLEAPGAIAELGAFSQLPTLRDKMVVVVQDQHHEKRSFISLGPLRQLDQRKRNHVCVVPTAGPEHLVDDMKLVLRSVHEKANATTGGGTLSPTHRAHQFALVLDFAGLAEVATFGDFKAVLGHFGADTNETKIHRLIFTLCKAKLLQSHRYGGVTYYLPVVRQQRWIDYVGIAGQFNRPRVTARIFARRGREDDKRRVHDLVFVKRGQRWDYL